MIDIGIQPSQVTTERTTRFQAAIRP